MLAPSKGGAPDWQIFQSITKTSFSPMLSLSTASDREKKKKQNFDAGSGEERCPGFPFQI